MFSHSHRKQRILLAVWDVLATVLAFLTAYAVRSRLPLDRDFYFTKPVLFLLLGLTGVLWVGIGVWLGAYERMETGRLRDALRLTLRQCGFGGVALVLVDYVFRLDISRAFLLLFVFLNTLLLMSLRVLYRRFVNRWRKEFVVPQHVLVAGMGARAHRIAYTVHEYERYGLRLAGMLDDTQPAQAVGKLPGLDHIPVYPLATLPDLLRRQIVDEIIFAVDSVRLRDLGDVFLLCDEQGVRTRIAVDFFPHVNSEMYLDQLGAVPLLTFSAAPHDELQLLLKRAMDVSIAAVALVALLPIMLLVGLLIKLTSPGPAIFRQLRCGLNGRRFMFYKFRSMCEDAEQMKESVRHLNQKQTAFKIPNDPRLTPIGGIMRKFSIDEWPQLWNVLRGDMSLVGPRPAVPEEVEHYQGWQRRRLRMRPGLTCLWALSGRDHLDFETWMRLDMEYIDNWSLKLDWRILLKTIPEVLLGRGAH